MNQECFCQYGPQNFLQACSEQKIPIFRSLGQTYIAYIMVLATAAVVEIEKIVQAFSARGLGPVA